MIVKSNGMIVKSNGMIVKSNVMIVESNVMIVESNTILMRTYRIKWSRMMNVDCQIFVRSATPDQPLLLEYAHQKGTVMLQV